MANFMYLLGAGASRNALPVVSEFSDSVNELAGKYGTFVATSNIDKELEPESDFHSTHLRILDDLKWLADIASPLKNASIDTYAKKLYLRRSHDELHRLKLAVWVYFTIAQCMKPHDLRYDKLFASLLTLSTRGEIELPQNLRIVTWNYDMQLEIAYFDYCRIKDDALRKITFSDSIVRLNGLASMHHRRRTLSSTDCLFKTFGTDSILAIVDDYKSYKDNFTYSIISLGFAWEQSEDVITSDLERVCKDVDTLIIIGYSFPFFNRSIDKILFDKLISLRKIYIQALTGEHRGIMERIGALTNKRYDITPLDDYSQFYIPHDIQI